MTTTAANLRPALHRHVLTVASAAPANGLDPRHIRLGLELMHRSSGDRRWIMMRPAPAMREAAAAIGGISSRQEEEDDNEVFERIEEIKAELYLALQGAERGIFGITSSKKSDIEGMVERLESMNPTPNPTDYLQDKVEGCWKLIYSTVTMLGVKRTKLGLRDFISLGDLYQIIDVAKAKATNVINFNAKGLKMLTGQLTIEASYKIASKSRVYIRLENSSIIPEQFMKLFEKNYDLLISIFNPEGWLDITYVDETMRIGRDDKGNIFVLERIEKETV